MLGVCALAIIATIPWVHWAYSRSAYSVFILAASTFSGKWLDVPPGSSTGGSEVIGL